MIANASRPAVNGPRSCHDSYGRPKAIFPTRAAAQRARRRFRVLDQHIYKCEPCAAYHLGHR